MATAAAAYNPAISGGLVAGTDYLAIAGVAGGQTATGGTAASEILRLRSTSNATKGQVKIGTAAAANCLFVVDENAGVVYFGDPTLVYGTTTTTKWIVDSAGNGGDTFVFMTGKNGSGIKTAVTFQNRGSSSGDDIQLAFNPATGTYGGAVACALKCKYDAASTYYRFYLSPGNASAAPQDVLIVDGRFNVALGKPSAATTATDGFVYLPSCAGTPTGVPTTFVSGLVPMVVDTTGVKIWFYIGGAWKGVVVA